MPSLTRSQRKIVKRMYEGDWPVQTFKGWLWADDNSRVSKRSLDAMVRNGWLDWQSKMSYIGFGMSVYLSAKAIAWAKKQGF